MENKKFGIPTLSLLVVLALGIGFFLSQTYTVRIQKTGENATVGHQDHQGQDEHGGEHDHEEHKEGSLEEHEGHVHEGHEGHGHEGHSGHKENVQMTENEMEEFGVETGIAAPGKLHTYIELPGEVAINPDRLAHIVPRVPGVVRKVMKTIGDTVRAGEIMAIIESSELGQAKIEYITFRKQLELAQVDLERMQTIHDNTAKMLKMLKEAPSPATLQKEAKGLDMGENRSRLISTYTNLILTKATHKREKNLYEKKITSQGDFLKAERDYKSAQAMYTATYDEISFSIKRQLMDKERAASVAESTLRAAERHLHVLGLTERELAELKNSTQESEKQNAQLTRIEIRSPFRGTVIEKHITLGEVIRNDSKVFVVADLSSVWVNLSIYQKDMPLVRSGQPVIITAGDSIPDVKGKISWVKPMVGEETRTSIARIVIPNLKEVWRPGLFITGKVEVSEVDVPLLVPKAAVQIIEGKKVIFVEGKDGFEAKAVKIGRSDENNLEILSGLRVGQRYVTKGGFTLKSNLAKGEFSEGHSH